LTSDSTIAALEKKLTDTEQAFAAVQEQLQVFAQRNTDEELALRQELREVKGLIVDREQRLSACLDDIQQSTRDIARLAGWLGRLDRGFANIINSKRWQLGHTLASLYRKILLKPPLPQPHELLRNLREQVRTWQVADDRRLLVPALRVFFPPRRERLREPREPLPPGVLEPEKISLIVLNRNGAAHLQNLLTSFVAHNTYRNVEWLVVDHASSDQSLRVLREWQSRLPLEIIACTTNYSFSYSNNEAAKKARGHYLFFLNNDIIFDDDVLPLLLARHQADASEVGLVGIQLVYPAHHAISPQQIQHLGVKFAEDISDARYRPYELGVKAAMSLMTMTSERVPAVTAAAVLCLREEFLRVGGFCEDYVYGYEDIDLCLSYWTQLKKGSCCVTDTWLIHDESATRRRENPDGRDARMRRNREVLQKRYGYAIKKAVQLDVLHGTRFWTDAELVVAFAITKAHAPTEITDSFSVLEFASACAARFDWRVRWLVRDRDWYDLKGVDLLIVLEDSYALTCIVGAKPTLVTIAWVRNSFARWGHSPGFDDYDIYLCASPQGADFLAEHHEKRPHVLHPATTEQLQSILVDFRDHKFRIAIKVPVPSMAVAQQWGEYPFALALKRAFVKQGHTVRIDPLPEWDTLRGFGDNVVLVMRGSHAHVPNSAQVNLLWSLSHTEIISQEECEPYDHVFVASSHEVERLRMMVKTPLSVLLPCADPTLFSLEAEEQVATILEVIVALDRRKRFEAQYPPLASGVSPQEECQL
jgi:GT2 family glycosyltransferase